MKKVIIRTVTSLLFLCMLSLIVILIKWVILLDSSVTPVDKSHLEAPVYLVTYADGPDVFLQNQNALTQSAINRGIDFTFNYRRQHLDAQFQRKNAVILQDPAGAGRWLWKPYLILETLKQMPEGAYLIYLDSGFVLKKNILSLLQQIGQNDIMVISYEPDIYGLLGNVVKREALIRGKCDTLACRQAPHNWAGLSFYRNSPKSRAFVKKWLELSEDPRILLPGAGELPEYPEFKLHHNDQATFNIVAYLMRKEITFLPHIEIHPYLAWHHRKENDVHKTLIEHTHHNNVRRIEKQIVKSRFLVKVRNFIFSQE